MAYCRWGDQSDIYVYHSCNEAIVCCHCSLANPRDDMNFDKRSQAITHIDDHIRAGHKVPDWVKDDLAEEIKTEGDIVKSNYRKGEK